MKIAIIGNGSWGTALALTLRDKNNVDIWGPLQNEIEDLIRDNENKKYLSGHQLSGITITRNAGEAIADSGLVIMAVPSKYMRPQMKLLSSLFRSGQIVISASKGIEQNTYCSMSEIISEYIPSGAITGALSGPSHAEEVARGIPTAVTAAAANPDAARIVQETCMTENFRVYTNNDLKGVQIGGAIKNIIAIAAGLSDGLGFGSNTISALMTRGLVEIIRYGKLFGARQDTFYGLSGLGDLITTCTSRFSRNHFVGTRLAEGKKWPEIEASMHMVAEGVEAVKAAYRYASDNSVSMPITGQIYKVLFEDMPPRDAVLSLMTRSPRAEDEECLTG